jgi:NADH dehydrogenase
VRQYGDVGQVEPVLCNIRDDASVTDVTNGADAVVNCVGILSESGKNTFQGVRGP